MRIANTRSPRRRSACLYHQYYRISLPTLHCCAPSTTPTQKKHMNRPTTQHPQNPGFTDGVRKDFAGFVRVIELPRICPVSGRTAMVHANRNELPRVAKFRAVSRLPVSPGGRALVFRTQCNAIGRGARINGVNRHARERFALMPTGRNNSKCR